MSLRLQVVTRRLRRQLGLPGGGGLALLVACLALYGTLVLPAQERLQAARQAAASVHERIQQAGTALSDQARPLDEQLAAFYRIFPGDDQATVWIGRIAAIAKRDGLTLQQADYQVSRDPSGKLTRLRMSLPLKGDYHTLRGFLTHLRAEIPIVSLEQVEFERQKIGDPAVEARLKLIVFLGHAT